MTPDSNVAFDPAEFRKALGEFATGITVITAEGPQGERVAMTMNSFSSVSLDPPLVLFSVDRRARSLAALEAAKGYAIHVLSREQEALSNRFAQAQTDKWTGVAWTAGYMNAPLLDGVLAHFECAPYATHQGGDHVIFVVRVVRFAAARENAKAPLAFFRGRYGTVESGHLWGAAWPLALHY